MLNTFDALAKFGNETSENEKNAETENKSGENAAVDISSVINRLNEMENKINQLLNRETVFPTRGNGESDNGEKDKINESEDKDNASETDS